MIKGHLRGSNRLATLFRCVAWCPRNEEAPMDGSFDELPEEGEERSFGRSPLEPKCGSFQILPGCLPTSPALIPELRSLAYSSA